MATSADHAPNASTSALEHRHKVFLTKFVDKHAWIQRQIALLEGATLPGVDSATDELDTVQLAAWRTEHDEIDAQVQALDTGELKSLRQLAKAASQKNLSGEDTDLIEITLKVLFSLDKLLHLLRLRRKALDLLQTRVRWDACTQKVELDLNKLLKETLQTFLRKARWSEPQEAAHPHGSPRQPRLSLSSSGSDVSLSSLSSLRGTTTSSSMARQMRAEIISLDLASLTSRIHTLVHSTLPQSGKILDLMVDTAPTPLPDRFLDYQDELEARVKDSLSGVGESCQMLAKQWREADEIWWSCSEVQQLSEALSADIAEATLKMPSEELAEALNERLTPLQATLNRIEAITLQRLPIPPPLSHTTDQGSSDAQLRSLLQRKLQTTSVPLARASAAVSDYRSAARALSAGLNYQIRVNGLGSDLRSACDQVKPVPFDLSKVVSSLCNLQAYQEACDKLSSLAASATGSTLPQSSDIIRELQKRGIDPNFRKSIQDSVLALNQITHKASTVVKVQTTRIAYYADACALFHALRSQKAHVETHTGLLRQHVQLHIAGADTIKGACSETRTDRSASIETDLAALQQQTQALQHSAHTIGEDALTLYESVNDKLRDTISSSTELQRLERLVKDLHTQEEAIASCFAEANAISRSLEELRGRISQAELEREVLQGLQEQFEQVEKETTAFSASLASRPLSIAGGRDLSLDLRRALEANDQAVRSRFNATCSKLSATLESATRQVSDLEASVDFASQLAVINDDTESLSQEISKVAHGNGIELLARQEVCQSARAKLDDLKKRLNIISQSRLVVAGSHHQLSHLLKLTQDSVGASEAALAACASAVHFELEAEVARAAKAQAQLHRQDRIKAEHDRIEAERQRSAAEASADTIQPPEGEESPRLHWKTEALHESVDQAVSESRSSTGSPACASSGQHEEHNSKGLEEDSHDSVSVEKWPELPDTGLQGVKEVTPPIDVSPLRPKLEDHEEPPGENASRAGSQLPADHDHPSNSPPRLANNEPAVSASYKQRDDSGVTESSAPTEADASAASSSRLGARDEHQNHQQQPSEEPFQLAFEKAIQIDVFGPRLSANDVALASPSHAGVHIAQEPSSSVEDGSGAAHQPEEVEDTADMKLLDSRNSDLGVHLTAETGKGMTDGDAEAITVFEGYLNEAMDLIDEDESSSLNHDDFVERVDRALEAIEQASGNALADQAAHARTHQLSSTWQQIRSHLLSTASSNTETPMASRPLSQASSVASELSSLSRRSVSAHTAPSMTVEDPCFKIPSSSRIASTGSHSRIPISSPRSRTGSTASLPHRSLVSPPSTRLPRPFSSALPTPPAAAASSLQTRKRYSVLSPNGAARTPTARQVGKKDGDTPQQRDVFSPPVARVKSSSSRRSSGAHQVIAHQRPNAYKADSKRRLDVAVGKIVNNMNVPVSIAPAETHKDEVGKYWIGDPPKLYYARILRSRTVMLRVGGGWQELGAFLATHYDQVFHVSHTHTPLGAAEGDKTLTSPSSSGALVPLRASQRQNVDINSPDGNAEVPWLSSSALKAAAVTSQRSSSSTITRQASSGNLRRQSSNTKMSRSFSHGGGHQMRRRAAAEDLPFDLTALLVKSTSRSPPRAAGGEESRRVSGPLPWRL